MKITYLNGDAIEPIDVEGYKEKLIIHICNNVGAWGSGFVVALSKKWWGPEHIFRQEYKKRMHSGEKYIPLGFTQLHYVDENTAVVNMVAQNRLISRTNPKPISYTGLRVCLKSVADYALTYNCSVHMPKIGSGRAGGDWQIIESIIQEELADKNIPTYVYIL